MRSIISLGVGNLEIDWGKNHSFRDHSPLFLPGDVSDAPYYYADDVVERKPAFVRRLRSVVRRLEMLGYGLGGCREKYDELVQFFPDWYDAPALVRIHILNKVVVVLDNDAAGRLAQNQITSLALPENVKVTVLPDLEECRSVRSIGPTGSVVCDVNGRATSIECFLDIWHADERPIVRWTAYIPDVDAWQGEIVRKAEYTKDFLDSIRRGNRYGFSRSELVWDQLQHPCTDSRLRC